MDKESKISMDTNRAELVGSIDSAPVFSHSAYGENFYELPLSVCRRSGAADLLRVILSDRLTMDTPISEGMTIHISGQIRTYNETDASGICRLNIVVFARAIEALDESCRHENGISLTGFVCKPPIRRTSPLGREICDLMLAANRMYGKSDYIPCIAWGRSAVFASGFPVGTHLSAVGRLQSREYKKRNAEGDVSVRTAYEVSVIRLEEVL